MNKKHKHIKIKKSYRVGRISYFLFSTFYFLLFTFSQAQVKDSLGDVRHVYQGNKELKENDFVNAEAEYRKAISDNPANQAAKYNLGNAYYKNNKNKEAYARYIQARKVATSKKEKHKSFHNMGNILMKDKKYEAAVEAYKNALRNNPTDDETRYNLALAKKKKEEQDRQKDQNKDDNKDAKDKQNQDKENKDKQDNKDQNQDKKEGDNNKDKNNSDKDGNKDQKDKDKGDKDDEKKDDKSDKEKKNESNDKNKPDDKNPENKKGQLSPQQVKSLLEAMNNQEKKLQEKLNAKKAKGIPKKNEKDW